MIQPNRRRQPRCWTSGTCAAAGEKSVVSLSTGRRNSPFILVRGIYTNCHLVRRKLKRRKEVIPMLNDSVSCVLSHGPVCQQPGERGNVPESVPTFSSPRPSVIMAKT